MKKRLEAELISIAHRILKLKNKSEVDQLYKETQKLYETLSVLKFYQDNFESVKTDVTEDVLDEKVAQSLEETPEETIVEVKEAAAPDVELAVEEETEEVSEDIVEEIPEAIVEEETIEEEEEVAASPEATEEEQPTLAFQPIFELEEEEETEEEEITPETKQAVVEEFLGDDYVDPVFVKPNETTLFATATEEDNEPKSSVINETKSIAIGLNDRIGFVKHLFDDSNEDFNRVLSQLNSFDSFEEAKNFIDDMVKPDYNNWQGNEDYAERFMELIEHKFQ